MTARNIGKGKARMLASSSVAEDLGASLFPIVEDDQPKLHEEGYKPS